MLGTFSLLKQNGETPRSLSKFTTMTFFIRSLVIAAFSSTIEIAFHSKIIHPKMLEKIINKRQKASFETVKCNLVHF